ncbi:hypothetical protein [Sphingomonas sp. CLY1604]|uniref:hypothetical protein n=1 Tax=Sphingomonas sp. CLY1604 TaxID=3457786 RepID=UPI003FD6D5B0
MEEIADFTAWQAMKEPDMRRRHALAEDRGITKLRGRIAAGDPKADPADVGIRPWRAEDASSFGRAICKADRMRRLAEIRAADPEGIGAVPLSILRDQVTLATNRGCGDLGSTPPRSAAQSEMGAGEHLPDSLRR